MTDKIPIMSNKFRKKTTFLPFLNNESYAKGVNTKNLQNQD